LILFTLASAIVCLIAVLFCKNRPAAVATERSQSLANHTFVPRLTPGQLKARAIARMPVASDTNWRGRGVVAKYSIIEIALAKRFC
jgi:hypothetical protein